MFKENSKSKFPAPKINLKESLLEDPIYSLKLILENAANLKKLKLKEDPYFIAEALNQANGEEVAKILIGNNTSPKDEIDLRTKLWGLLVKAKISPTQKGPDGRLLTYYKSNELVEFLKTLEKPEESNPIESQKN